MQVVKTKRANVQQASYTEAELGATAALSDGRKYDTADNRNEPPWRRGRNDSRRLVADGCEEA
jgi:hypothetical protein